MQLESLMNALDEVEDPKDHAEDLFVLGPLGLGQQHEGGHEEGEVDLGERGARRVTEGGEAVKGPELLLDEGGGLELGLEGLDVFCEDVEEVLGGGGELEVVVEEVEDEEEEVERGAPLEDEAVEEFGGEGVDEDGREQTVRSHEEVGAVGEETQVQAEVVFKEVIRELGGVHGGLEDGETGPQPLDGHLEAQKRDSQSVFRGKGEDGFKSLGGGSEERSEEQGEVVAVPLAPFAALEGGGEAEGVAGGGAVGEAEKDAGGAETLSDDSSDFVAEKLAEEFAEKLLFGVPEGKTEAEDFLEVFAGLFDEEVAGDGGETLAEESEAVVEDVGEEVVVLGDFGVELGRATLFVERGAGPGLFGTGRRGGTGGAAQENEAELVVQKDLVELGDEGEGVEVDFGEVEVGGAQEVEEGLEVEGKDEVGATETHELGLAQPPDALELEVGVVVGLQESLEELGPVHGETDPFADADAFLDEVLDGEGGASEEGLAVGGPAAVVDDGPDAFQFEPEHFNGAVLEDEPQEGGGVVEEGGDEGRGTRVVFEEEQAAFQVDDFDGVVVETREHHRLQQLGLFGGVERPDALEGLHEAVEVDLRKDGGGELGESDHQLVGSLLGGRGHGRQHSLSQRVFADALPDLRLALLEAHLPKVEGAAFAEDQSRPEEVGVVHSGDAQVDQEQLHDGGGFQERGEERHEEDLALVGHQDSVGDCLLVGLDGRQESFGDLFVRRHRPKQPAKLVSRQQFGEGGVESGVELFCEGVSPGLLRHGGKGKQGIATLGVLDVKTEESAGTAAHQNHVVDFEHCGDVVERVRGAFPVRDVTKLGEQPAERPAFQFLGRILRVLEAAGPEEEEGAAFGFEEHQALFIEQTDCAQVDREADGLAGSFLEVGGESGRLEEEVGGEELVVFDGEEEVEGHEDQFVAAAEEVAVDVEVVVREGDDFVDGFGVGAEGHVEDDAVGLDFGDEFLAGVDAHLLVFDLEVAGVVEELEVDEEHLLVDVEQEELVVEGLDVDQLVFGGQLVAELLHRPHIVHDQLVALSFLKNLSGTRTSWRTGAEPP